MQVVILSNAKQKEEWVQIIPEGISILWKDQFDEFLRTDADVYLDLLFERVQERIDALASLLPKLVIVNSVVYPLREVHPSFVRINAWPGFFHATRPEASFLEEEVKKRADVFFALINKQPEWVQDIAGFITPRIICMIINEAYLALDEGISTKEEIDTAMQLGTSYPFGPFEWGRRIGLKQVASLLETLSTEHLRYTPSRLLLEESEEGSW
jgi:3-hydroxybutyryl-CoA dehydrogenase